MQGGPLSPLLSNIYLDDLDKELEQRGLPFVRYADDFVIFKKSQAAAQRVYRSVERFLSERLKLIVNHDKSSIRKTDGQSEECIKLAIREKRSVSCCKKALTYNADLFGIQWHAEN